METGQQQQVPSERKKIALVLGATGRLGASIVDKLLQHGNYEVRGMVRPKAGRDEKPMTSRGVKLYSADVTSESDEAKIREACSGVFCVISALLGLDDRVMIDGQRRVLRIAKEQNVKRFIPSEFSVNLEKLDVNESYFAKQRLTFARENLQKDQLGNVQWASINQGIFMEMFFAPKYEMLDMKAKELRYYGDDSTLDLPLQFTAYADTARATSIVAMDDNIELNRRYNIVGDTKSLRQISDMLREVTGTPFKLVKQGSLDDLRNKINQQRQSDEGKRNPRSYVINECKLNLFSGKGKFDRVDNDKFEDKFKFTQLRDYLTRAQGRKQLGNEQTWWQITEWAVVFQV